MIFASLYTVVALVVFGYMFNSAMTDSRYDRPSWWSVVLVPLCWLPIVAFYVFCVIWLILTTSFTKRL